MTQKVEDARHGVIYYGRFTFYGGCLVFLISVLTFFVEFARLLHISHFRKHDSTWIIEDDPNPNKSILDKMSKAITADPENEKAI